MSRWFMIVAVLVFATALAPAVQSSGYHVVRRYPIGGEGGWDYLLVDPATRRLYVSRGTRVAREPLGEIGAHCLAALEQFFLLDRLHDGETYRRRQRIGYMRGVEGKPALMTTILDLVAGDDTCQRHATAQRFRHRHDVRRHFQM